MALLGIMLRTLDKTDLKTKDFYIRALVVLAFPLFWLWTTYVFLTMNLEDFAIRYGLSGLISALFICIGIILYIAGKHMAETEDSLKVTGANKADSEETESQKLKREFHNRSI